MERNSGAVVAGLAGMLALVMIVVIALVTGQSMDDQRGNGCGPGSAVAALAADPGGAVPGGGRAGFTVAPSEPYHGARSVTAHAFTITPPMLRNVATVAGVARQIWPNDLNRQQRAVLIATITMMVETNLENHASPAIPETMSLPHDGVSVDHDSAGVFQQRVRQGYHGTAAQIMNVEWAASLFFGHPHPDAPANHDWGLDDYQRIKGRDWLTEDPGAVAAAIQRPARQYEYRYGLWVRDAAVVIQAAAGMKVDTTRGVNNPCLGADTALDCPGPGLPAVEQGLTPDARRVLACGHQRFPQIKDFAAVGSRPANVDDDHQTGRAVDFMVYRDKATGDQIAAWAQANAAALGVKYVIWYDRIWSLQRDREGWRPYTNPNGTDDTAAHRDHVHISVHGTTGTGLNPSSGGPMGTPTVPIARGRYTLSAVFGAVGSWSRYHTGQDLAAPVGTPVLAAADGTVEPPTAGAWAGTHLILRHADGSATLYAHLSATSVQPGAQVHAGQPIAAVGMTGRTFGPHLHFEHYPPGANTRDPYTADDPMAWLATLGAQTWQNKERR